MFEVVRQLEAEVAKFSGSKYAVAVNSGTNAIFLSLKYAQTKTHRVPVIVPARTFISVPMAVKQARLSFRFEDFEWNGIYQLKPLPVWDGALRFRRGMYNGGLHCLSFHARKILNIGEGGMVLTDDEEAHDWLQAASYSGRKPPDYRVEDIETEGWQMYMHPEKAARGLHLMGYIGHGQEDQNVSYPDLRDVKLWK